MDVIDLAKLSLREVNETIEALRRQLIFVARQGDKVMACGGPGKIISGSRVKLYGRNIATVGCTTHTPACSHGCPGCPHSCRGRIITGLPNLVVDGVPVATVGSECVHSACCGPNTEIVVQGYGGVLVGNGNAAAHKSRGKLTRGWGQ